MGRIKPKPLKAITEQAFERNEEEFTTNFSANKTTVLKNIDVKSKKLKNVIAGYATRLKKRKVKK